MGCRTDYSNIETFVNITWEHPPWTAIKIPSAVILESRCASGAVLSVMVEGARKPSGACARAGAGKGVLRCLLEQKLSLWTISCVNRRKPGAQKVQSSCRRQRHRACVCVCVCVQTCVRAMMIRATTLPHCTDSTCCVFCGVPGGTLHTRQCERCPPPPPRSCTAQRPQGGW